MSMFSSPSLFYLGYFALWCTNTVLPKDNELSCNNSFLLCFLIGGANTFNFNKQHNFWHRFFQTFITLIRVSSFSDSQLHTSYYCLWIPASPLPWATNCKHFHPEIPKQYHQHWNSVFHLVILDVPKVIEDAPFSNVTRTPSRCVAYFAICSNSISQVY